MVNLPALSESIIVAAPPSAVWDAVVDRKAMARRSPELVGMWVLGRPQVGRWSVNLNRNGWFAWPTLSRITDHTAPTASAPGRFAFSVWPTKVEWSYEVTGEGAGSRLTEARTAVVDPSLLVRTVAKIGLRGQESHDAELADGIRTTLAAIEADVTV